MVGGSSSVNGMVYVRGNRANFDSWAAEGNTGWSADEVNTVYKRMEDWVDGEDAYRGAGGPIKVTRHSVPVEPSFQFVQATADTLGVKVLQDYNAESQEGASMMQQNAAGGLRYSASRGYIHGRALPSLSLQTEVHVAKVVIDNGRATGVQVIDKDGELRTIRAGKEVILAAGVFGSPQLLMLSGIGHADHLAQHGIPCLADLPVGDNMHDHLFVPLTFHVPTAKHRGNPWHFARGLAREVTRGQLVPRELGLRVRRLRAYVAGDRRTRPADPPAAVVLPLAQPGRADPAQGRPARVRDAAVDADLPAQPRHPAAGVGRPDRGAADRLPVPRRAGRRRGARRGQRDDPRDHGERGVRRRGQE